MDADGFGSIEELPAKKSLAETCLFENFIFKPDRSFIQMEMSHLGVQGKQSGSRLKVLESRKRVKKK